MAPMSENFLKKITMAKRFIQYSKCSINIEVPPAAQTIHCSKCDTYILVSNTASQSNIGYARGSRSISGGSLQISKKISSSGGFQPRSNKRALLCGVIYKGLKYRLRGTVNDVRKMQEFLTQRFDFPEQSIRTLTVADNLEIPSDKTQLTAWFGRTIQDYKVRRATLDPALVKAEDNVRIIKVSKNGGGNFKTVTDAVNSVPAGNTQRVIIWIGPGEYREKIKIDRSKPFITFYGSPSNMPMLSFNGTAATYGTVDSASLIVESDYFMAVNIIVINSAPRPDGIRKGAQAVAVRASGDKAAFYNSQLIGFQDTLCDDRNRHFFKGCYINGTVDFIFGSGKSLYLDSELHAIGEASVITAQARNLESEDNGYSFVHCTVSGTGSGTFLGRAWMNRPKVVFSHTYMSSVVNPLGWSDINHAERDSMVFFGEYNNLGPGADTSKRAKFTKKLDANGAKPFNTLNYIGASSWLLPPPNLALH